MRHKLRVWFNPEKRYYEAYDDRGQAIPGLCKLTVCDNWDASDMAGSPTAIFEVEVEVVNENPENKIIE